MGLSAATSRRRRYPMTAARARWEQNAATKNPTLFLPCSCPMVARWEQNPAMKNLTLFLPFLPKDFKRYREQIWSLYKRCIGGNGRNGTAHHDRG